MFDRCNYSIGCDESSSLFYVSAENQFFNDVLKAVGDFNNALNYKEYGLESHTQLRSLPECKGYV